jgi:hypothetical protein
MTSSKPYQTLEANLPDVQKLNALIEIVDKMLKVQIDMNKRNGSFDDRDKLDAIAKELAELKSGK